MKKSEQTLQKLNTMIAELPPGAKLPPLRTLKTELEVSLTTLNRVFAELEKAEKVRIIHGSGIYTTEKAAATASLPPVVDILYFGTERSLNASGYVRDLIHYLSLELGEEGVGATVSIFPCGGSLHDAEETLRKLRRQAVLSVFMDNPEFYHYFRRNGIAHVAVSPDIMRKLPNSIYIDNRTIIRLIFDRLTAAGCRDIAFLHHADVEHFSRDLYEREKYFYEECMKRRLPQHAGLVRFAGFTAQSSCEALREMFDSGEKISALIAGDAFAADLYGVCEERGLRVGRDIAVVGIDGLESNTVLRPRLSGTYIPRDAIARCACEMLRTLIRNSDTPLPAREIAPAWIERESIPAP